VRHEQPGLLLFRPQPARRHKLAQLIIGIHDGKLMIGEVEQDAIDLLFARFNLLAEFLRLLAQGVDPLLVLILYGLQLFFEMKYFDAIGGQRLALDIQLFIRQIFQIAGFLVVVAVIGKELLPFFGRNICKHCL